MIVRRPRPLPGIRFEVQTPALPEVLPRMDIPLFVGFSASGPINQPVAVESPTQFGAIFGEDAPLVWDEVRGEQVYAYLAPAVRAFFRGGGQRCWIVRVAGDAKYNQFPIPGLVRVVFNDSGYLETITPAFARARSEGGWSDTLQVSTSLRSRAVATQIKTISANTVEIAVQQTATLKVRVGDLLRLRVRDQDACLLCVAKTVTSFSQPPFNALVSSQPLTWFTIAQPPLVTTLGLAQLYRPSTGVVSIGCQATFVSTTNGSFKLNLALSSLQSLEFGTLIIAAFGTHILRIMVEESRIVSISPTVNQLQVEGHGYWVRGALPSPDTSPLTDGLNAAGEVLTLDLLTLDHHTDRMQMVELGFAPEHARYWNALPTDLDAYDPSKHAALTVDNPHADLWREATDPRFPLAGGSGLDDTTSVYFPLAITVLPTDYLGAVADGLSRLQRDGLETFDATVFLDDRFDGFGVRTLIERATSLRYEMDNVERFRGIYTALELDEVTLVAIPDAVHPGWQQAETPLTIPNLTIKDEPVTSNIDPCAPTSQATEGNFTLQWSSVGIEMVSYTLEETQSPASNTWNPIYNGTATNFDVHVGQAGLYYYRVRAERGQQQTTWSENIRISIPLPLQDKSQFLVCGLDPLPTPKLTIQDGLAPLFLSACVTADPAAQGNFTLTWTSFVTSGTDKPIYILEESSDPDPSSRTVIYTGTGTKLDLYGRPPGTYYYRIHVEWGRRQSVWSDSVCISIQAARGWLLNRIYSQLLQHDLLDVQKRLLELCAARGDMLAIFALPITFRETDAIRHVQALQSLFVPGMVSDIPNLNSLLRTGFGSSVTLSYGALYHPWLFTTETTQATVRLSPPDGAACGVLALRARNRGAWIAPANEPIDGVVALTPSIAESRWLDLQEAHINIVRQEPSGFLMLHDDTLAGDTDETLDLRNISVRRLLMLLRRLVLKVGPSYVFEPNNDTFRRSIQRGFVALMEYLFARGAFAGKTPDTSFQVRTDVSTTEMMEQGRFVVELRVAPSLPMRFLTVRLVQTGDRSSVTEGS